MAKWLGADVATEVTTLDVELADDVAELLGTSRHERWRGSSQPTGLARLKSMSLSGQPVDYVR